MIEQAETIEGYRLAPQQSGYFLLPNQSGLITFGGLELKSTLDLALLKKSLQVLITRFEVFHTGFQSLTSATLPLQVIAEEPKFAFDLIEKPSTTALSQLLAETLNDERNRAFDLKSCEMLRIRCFKLSADHHLLTFAMPAVTADAITLDYIVQHLLNIYAEGAAELSEEDAEDLLQYVQYSEWQHQMADDEDSEESRDFWQQQYQQEVPQMALPYSKADARTLLRSAESFHPHSVSIPLDQKSLHTFLDAQEWQAAPFFLAHWQMLLARLSGSSQLLTAVDFDGRHFEELADGLGFFSKQVPLLSEWLPQLPFAEWYERTADQWEQHENHQDAYWPEQSPIQPHQMPFTFMFRTPPELETGALEAVILQRENFAYWFALRLEVIEENQQYQLRLSYDPQMQDEEIVKLLAERLATLIQQTLTKPNGALRNYAWIGVNERDLLIHEWGHTALRSGLNHWQDLPQWFEKTCDQRPNETALVFEDEALSFAEVDQKANALARHLRRLGVAPEVKVPLFLPRGTDWFVAMLAVWKAGGAYVPLDPEQPKLRVHAILNDLNAATVVTHQTFANLLPENVKHVVCLGDAAILAENTDRLAASAQPENLAYVLYTSGSTGQPKGVMINRGSVSSLLQAHRQIIYAEQHTPQRVGVNANFSFDASVKQLAQWLWGDTLVGIPEDIRADGKALIAYLQQTQIESLDTTPSQLRLLLDMDLLAAPDLALKRVLVGGEAIDPTLWQTLAASPTIRFWNVYGPTECTVNASFAAVTQNATEPHIGNPIPGTLLSINDMLGSLQPAGLSGELLIGGTGLARGYLNDPARTAAYFVPDPNSERPGARRYRSGDRAEYLRDGNVAYRGRIDLQVKIRGFRVEPGEIEAVLLQHPGVAEAAVVAKATPNGDQRLIGYVSPNTKGSAGQDQAKRHSLPNGMALYQQNKNETDYLFEEIFAKSTYAFYGIDLPDQACIVDVGANIGMFSLFVLMHCKDPKIYAFEPLPPIYGTLTKNIQLYDNGQTQLFNFGLSHSETDVEFTYYPQYSMMSGQQEYADAEDEVRVVKRFLEKEAEGGSQEATELLQHADELLETRFEETVHTCRLRRLGDVLKEQQIQHIDLLKIDVQRAEMDVLMGLEPEQWAMIDQVVMEVHDHQDHATANRIDELMNLVKEQGFDAVAEQDELLTGTDRYNVYARRHGLTDREANLDRFVANQALIDAAKPIDAEQLREYTRDFLPAHMVPSAMVLLDAMPLTSSGKPDRKNLPDPELNQQNFIAPSTPMEESLAAIWCDLLGFPEISVDANFFDLGGHSLLATQLVSRIRQILKVDIPLRTLFETPTIASLAQKLVASDSAANAAVAPPLQPAERQPLMPLSFAQQRLWFIDQLEPETMLYNQPFAFEIKGDLKLDKLAEAFSKLAERHEIMRTRVVTENSQGWQVIDAPQAIQMPVTDLRAYDPETREQEADRLATAEANHPFNLATGPLWRLSALQLDDQHFVILLTIHHIISDQWTVHILIEEVATLYNAAISDSPAELPELPIQYADFAAWQRGWLQGDVLEAKQAYWQKQLEHAPPLLTLPIDRARPALRSYRGATLPFTMNNDTSQTLLKLGSEIGATPFMVWTAALAATLARYANQDDVCIGTPIAGRDKLETENLIGFFINNLVLRVPLHDNPGFKETLKRVREASLGAYTHQDLPFDKLVEDLVSQRDMRYSPLFQVSFNLNDERMRASEMEPPDFEGLEILPFQSGDDAPIRYDLTINMHRVGNSYAGSFRYNIDIFEEATIAEILKGFQAMARHFAADPDKPYRDVPLTQRVEPVQSLPQPSAYRDPATLFKDLISTQPQQQALICQDKAFNYATLGEQVGKLANRLRDAGAGPETIVAQLLPRDERALIAILATWAAGAAYLPLSEQDPEARQLQVLQDSGTQILITADPEQAAPARFDGTVLPYTAPEGRDIPSTLPQVHCDAQNLAYVLYTSGSSGQPKGVCVPRGNIAPLAASLTREIYATLPQSPRRIGLAAPLYFDASVKQLIMLLQGHTLVLLPEEVRTSPASWLDYVRKHKIDVIDSTPALLRLLLEEGLGHDLERDPQAVLIGGEAIDEALWQTLQFSEKTRYFNVYGPTETTVDATVSPITTAQHRPTLGPALPHATAHVLDAAWNPLPDLLPGELCIGGAGVTRGYLGQPDRTALTFIPDAFSTLAGSRLYRTGDKVRRRADSTFEYLGRIDFQIKVRGYRIEPGEVEHCLRQVEGVEQALVLVNENYGDHLLAYVTGNGLTQDKLRARTSLELPNYMQPTFITIMDAFPLTPQGKMDRRNLPAPSLGGQKQDDLQPDRDPVTAILAGILTDLLGVDQIRNDDHFFEMGGHSLMAIQLVSQLRKTFDISLPVRAIFDHPRLSELAAVIKQNQHGTLALPDITKAASPYKASFAQERLWVICQMNPGQALYNIPKAERIRGAFDLAAWRQAFHTLVARHDVLRTTFVAGEQGPEVRLLPIETVAEITWHDETESLASDTDRDQRAQEIALAEANTAFDLTSGPLFRCSVVRLAEQDHLLLVTLHHTITDRLSSNVLRRELDLIFQSYTHGLKPDLPALDLNYFDASAWQRQFFEEGGFQSQLDYWKAQLSELPNLDLPTDFHRPALESFEGASLTVKIDNDITDPLHQYTSQQGSTMFMSLLASFQLILARFSNQQDFGIGIPIAGRNHPATANMAGLFVNSLVIRNPLSPDMSFHDYLQQTRKTMIDAYANQDLPFEKLVDELQIKRDLSRSPLFQVMFNYDELARDDAATDAAQAETSKAQAVANDAGKAMFDITLTLAYKPGFGLVADWNYRTALYKRETIEIMASAWRTLLQHLALSPQQQVFATPMIDDSKLKQLQAWGRGTHQQVAPATIGQQLAQKLVEADDQPLVLGGERPLSAADFYQQSRQLAQRVSALLPQPHAPVALCMAHRVELLTAVCGCLMQGIPFVPIDPSQPAERIAYICKDVNIAAAIVDETSAPLFANMPQLIVDQNTWQTEKVTADLPHIHPQQTAYTIFTSGSTGTPKGVMISQANLAQGIQTIIAEQRLRADCRLLVTSSMGFDISYLEMLGPILAGGQVVMSQKIGPESIAQIQQDIAQHQVNVVQTTPSAWRMLLLSGWQLPPNFTAFSGGEALPMDLAKDLSDQGATLWNFYGPTEATIWVTGQRVSQDHMEHGMPLGHVNPNTALYVLNQSLQPQPEKAAGRLYIGGPQVGIGYHKRPDLTAVSFLPDPFSQTPGARMYDTGDLVRWRNDGLLDFLGRADHQIKLRGFRIELGEIEAQLQRLPHVNQAAVALVDQPAGQRLVAYVASQDAATLDTAAIQASLSATLPDYMLPEQYVFLDALPLSASGKVNRNALPEPSLAAQEEHFINPRTEQEWQVWHIFSDVLESQTLDIHADFFEHGGNSLLAIALISRVNTIAVEPIGVATLFQNPTVAKLAAQIQAQVGSQNVVHQLKDGQDSARIWIHPVGGTPFCYANLARLLVDQKSFYGIQVPDLHKQPVLPATLEDLAALYVDHIAEQFKGVDIELGGWSAGGVFALEVARQLKQRNLKVQHLTIVDVSIQIEAQQSERTAQQDFLSFLANLDGPTDTLIEQLGEAFELEEAFHFVLAEAKALGVLPDSATIAEIERYYQVHRHLAELIRAYKPGEYVGDVQLLKTETFAEEAIANWQQLIPERHFHMTDIPGEHHQLMDPPYVQHIADQIMTSRLKDS